MGLHRCTEAECPFLGKTTSRSCGCHKTDEQVLTKQRDDLLALIKLALSLKGGWREAIVELEDHCSEPVRLRNMLAAADQLDAWATTARAAITKAAP